MPKISLDNLERYDGHLKDWCDARFAERKVHENWHEAGPSGAVSFYPVSNRPIDPVVNFAFTETLPEGTKGPDNPSTITGVSSITVTRCETVGVNSTAYIVALGDTYYGGSVDLSTGVMTVTHEGYVFNGEETFNKFVSGNNAYYTFATQYPAKTTTSCTCTHFLAGGNPGNLYTKTDEGKIVFINNDIDSIVNLKAWFSEENANNTPVTVVYLLATPYTIQLTPLQIYSLSQIDPYTSRINTVYSDQQSVLVRYPKSPIVTGSELDNAILSLGGD